MIRETYYNQQGRIPRPPPSHGMKPLMKHFNKKHDLKQVNNTLNSIPNSENNSNSNFMSSSQYCHSSSEHPGSSTYPRSKEYLVNKAHHQLTQENEVMPSQNSIQSNTLTFNGGGRQTSQVSSSSVQNHYYKVQQPSSSDSL